MTVFFSTTPNPSSQEEGTTGRQPAVWAETQPARVIIARLCRFRSDSGERIINY